MLMNSASWALRKEYDTMLAIDNNDNGVKMAKSAKGLTDAEMLERYKRIQANNSRAGTIAARNMTAEQRHERAVKAALASAKVRKKDSR